MKSNRILIYITILAIFGTSCNSGARKDNIENITNGKPVITFDQLEYDFGRIIEGEKVACVFRFKNSGDGDLIINSATTSCGCTVPRFEDKPIAPGGEGTMEVVFDSSHRNGLQTKTITVRSNAKVKVVVLRITAEIIKNEG